MIDPTVIGVAVRYKRNRFFLVRSDGVPCGLVALPIGTWSTGPR